MLKIESGNEVLTDRWMEGQSDTQTQILNGGYNIMLHSF